MSMNLQYQAQEPFWYGLELLVGSLCLLFCISASYLLLATQSGRETVLATSELSTLPEKFHTLKDIEGSRI